MSPNYGAGLTHSAPGSMVCEINLAGTWTRFSDQYADRRDLKLTRAGNTGRVQADFKLTVPAGGGYDIHPEQEVHLYSTDDLLPAGAYNRYLGGYLKEVDSTVNGGEKVWTISANDYGDLLDNPKQQITTQWPPGDGTPVVNQTIALGVTAGSGVNFTVPDPKDIYVNKVLFAQNADGTNTERITITAIAGRTATATFAWNKSANWILSGGISDKVLLADGWQQLSTSYTTSTTVVSPGTVTVTLADTCASMGIVNGTLVYCLDPGGVNQEMVTASSVGTNTFTATFTQSHVVNWHARPMTSFSGLIDTYYNNVGQTVSKVTIVEVIKSLPHVHWSDCKPRKVLEDVRSLATDYGMPSLSTTVATALFSGGSHTVTPASMAGIYIGQVLLVSNSDGYTNREYVWVSAVNHTTGTFTAYFQFVKSAGWIVSDAASAPDFFMQVIQDNPAHTALWTPQLVWYNRFDPTNRTLVDLGDFSNPSASQDRYSTYTRKLNSMREFTKQDVFNPDTQARGSYEDTSMSTVIGRTKSAEPLVIQDATIQTNADAAARAKTYVQKFRTWSETIDSIESYHQVSQYLFYQGLTVLWSHTVEGGTPAIYALPSVSVDFAEGVAKYTYQLGDAIEEVGDKPIPTYGTSGITKDTNPPQTPKWNSGTGWVVSNVWNQYTGYTDLTITVNINGELDLQSVWFYYTTNLSGRWRYANVLVSGGDRTAQVTLSLSPGTLYYFKAYAVDISQNVSYVSSIVNTTTANQGAITDARYLAPDVQTNPMKFYDASGNYRGTINYDAGGDYLRFSASNGTSDTYMWLQAGTSGATWIKMSDGLGIVMQANGGGSGGPVSITAGQAMSLTAANASGVTITGGPFLINGGVGYAGTIGTDQGLSIFAGQNASFVGNAMTITTNLAAAGSSTGLLVTGAYSLAGGATVAGVQVTPTLTGSSSNTFYGLRMIASLSSTSGTTTPSVVGSQMQVSVSASHTETITNIYGAQINIVHGALRSTPTTFANVWNALLIHTVATNVTETTAYGLQTQPSVAGTGVIGTFYHLYLKNATGTGTLSGTQYGLYIESMTKGAGNYAIYSAGGKVYHQAGAAGTVAMQIDGFSGQTAHLTDWTINNGSPVSYIDSIGSHFATHFGGSGSAPSISAGTGAGTGPTLAISGDDTSGVITLTTGTAPAANATVFTVTFFQAYGVAPYVMLTPSDSNTMALAGAMPWLDRASTTTALFVVKTATALAAAKAYTWQYMVMQ